MENNKNINKTSKINEQPTCSNFNEEIPGIRFRRLWGDLTQEQLNANQKYIKKCSPATQKYNEEIDWINWIYDDRNEFMHLANAMADQRERDAKDDKEYEEMNQKISEMFNKSRKRCQVADLDDIDDNDFQNNISVPSISNSNNDNANNIPNNNIVEDVTNFENNRRFRNFQFVMPINRFLNIRTGFTKTINEKAKFFIAQEENIVNGENVMQCFITLKNSHNCQSAKSLLKIDNIKGVPYKNVPSEIDNCSEVGKAAINGLKMKWGYRKRIEDESFWTTFLESESIQVGLDMVEEERPLDYIRMQSKLQCTLISKIGEPTKPKFNSNWKLGLFNWDDQRTKVFIGGTGIGKTNFALSHFNQPIHITIRQDFEKMGPCKFRYDGCVIDDLPLHMWTPEEIINLTDTSYNTSINVKYGTGIIPAKTKIIICCNTMDDFINQNWNKGRKEAIRRRCHFYIFGNEPLFTNDDGESNRKPIISKFTSQMEEYLSQNLN